MNRRRLTAAAVPLAALALAACGGATDQTTEDQAGDATAPPAQTTVTLPTTATVTTDTGQAELARILSGGGSGQRVPLAGVEFQDGKLQQDPNTTLTSLAAILNAHPTARVRIEVAPGADGDREQAGRRAEEVMRALARAGVAQGRLESGAAQSGASDPVSLVVL